MPSFGFRLPILLDAPDSPAHHYDSQLVKPFAELPLIDWSLGLLWL
jgi:hypothetical protein